MIPVMTPSTKSRGGDRCFKGIGEERMALQGAIMKQLRDLGSFAHISTEVRHGRVHVRFRASNGLAASISIPGA